MRKHLLLIFLAGWPILVFSQDWQYRSYTEKEGLSDNTINCIVQDSSGFLWIGTSYGLNRFDGNAFDNFYYDPSDTTTILSNEIQTLFLDRKKRLWAGTSAGISLYDPAGQTFHNYVPDSLTLPVMGASFEGIGDDDSGYLWVAAKNDLLIFDPATGRFRSSGWAGYADQVRPPGNNHTRIVTLNIIRRNETSLWVLTTDGLFSVDTHTRRFRYYPYPAIPDFYGCHLDYADPSGNVWIGTYMGGLVRYNDPTGKWITVYTPLKVSPPSSVSGIRPFHGDTVMYCYGRSVIFFDPLHNSFSRSIFREPGKNPDLPGNDFKNIVRLGDLLWLGTGHGLVRIMPRQDPFSFHRLPNAHNVNRVFRSSLTGNLVFGENGAGAFTSDRSETIHPVTSSPRTPIRSAYLYFQETADGKAFINGNENLYSFDQRTNSVTEIRLPSKRSPDNAWSVRNSVVDKKERLWTRAVDQGILELDPDEKVPSFNKKIPFTANRQINTLYYDHASDCLWMSMEFDGVFVYDIKKNTVSHFPLNTLPYRRSAALICITGDGVGNVFLLDYHHGLVCYNGRTQQFTRYSINEGLISENCSWIAFDPNGFLWIASDKGLGRFDTSTKKFTNYYTSEGYPAPQQFLSTDRMGNIYMPADSGYFEWNNRDLDKEDAPGKIYLRNMTLFGRNRRPDSVYHFSYKENTVRFQFGLLSIEGRSPVLLEYRLGKGDWQNIGFRQYVSFNNLPPDDYEIFVRRKNDPVLPFHIRFTIAPPFWRTWWFMVLSLSLVLLASVYFTRRRIKVIRGEANLLHQLAESEMSALRSQMNPHFIFNTLNSINSYIIEKRDDEASDYLTDFSRLMRIVLEHSKKKTVGLDEELKALKLYMELEARRLENSFDYQISISPDIHPENIQLPPLVIQPFVENAIWHGLRGKKGSGLIEIKIMKDAKDIHISICDDGVGRSAAKKARALKENSSFGADATTRRLLLYDRATKVMTEDLFDNNHAPAGTCVHIYLENKTI